MTAAWLHGLEVPPPDPIEVTLAKEFGIAARSGVRVRQAALNESDVAIVRGMRATAIERTVAEVCARLSLVEAVVITDAVLHWRRTGIVQLAAWANAHHGRPGVGRLRRVLALVEPAAESPMESRLRMVLVLAGLRRPRAQVPIKDRDGRFVGRVDLYYPEARHGIEYDGAIHRNSLVEDNRRQNKLLRAGVRLLRFTAADVLQKPDSIVLQVRALLALAG